MSIKHKILGFLIENQEKAFNMYELARVMKIDYKLVYINVKKLEKSRSIEVEDLKSQKRCIFRANFNEDVFIVENQRRNKLLERKEFKAIYDKLKVINKQFILLVFGSYAKGNSIKSSDIDLLLISDKENVKVIKEKLQVLPLKIHFTNITYDSFIGMLKSKELSVTSEALKKNILLFGIEDYYRLLEYAENK